MITLAELVERYRPELERRHGSRLSADHHAALNAIRTCHTPARGELDYRCEACRATRIAYPSCGHRACPACQHSTNNQWLDRQRRKLLPVTYYLVTFTLPAKLRGFARSHPEWTYATVFQVATETLQTFGRNEKALGDRLGLTAVLHTHSRRLDYHPHLHVIIPGGSLDRSGLYWKAKAGKYLFNGRALAKLFRAKFLAAMKGADYWLPRDLPKTWVVQCERVGQGEPALTYLARYLYRGVISERNILSLDDDRVTFRYQDGQSKQIRTRTLHAADFLWLVLQHVLPKGFHRVRDYGLLHGNARRRRQRVQLLVTPSFSMDPSQELTRPCRCACGGSWRLVHRHFPDHATRRRTTRA